MKLQAFETIICRTPAFGLTAELAEVWTDLKAKIKSSSPAFYQQIAHVQAHEIKLLEEKIQFTIWKYFNRAKYRATPFGNFAAYSLLPLVPQSKTIKISKHMHQHTFVDWSAKEIINNNYKQVLKQASTLYRNTSCYQIDDEIRYLRFTEGTFELAAVNDFAELSTILKICTLPTAKKQIYELLETQFQFTIKDSNQLLIQLLQLQLLTTEQLPNITGLDYFNRLKQLHTGVDKTYILSERQLNTGGITSQQATVIKEALQFLAQHLPYYTNPDLLNFKNAFAQKFEQQEVSLAIAMDPMVGIGYGNLEQMEQQNELIALLKAAPSENKIETISYTPLHQFLMNALMENDVIDLAEFELKQVQQKPVLPNTLSVLFTNYQGNPVIANAGGCTANALLGRFTLGNEQLEAHCKNIAQVEQEANPDVLFFDIPYQAEKNIDNVNRRKHIYAHELPILTWSCTPSPLDFNDVMLSIQGDEIILRSKKLGKRLIPRIPSAYNYSRSDLAVYRFLCDLQHQNIQSNLNFDLQHLLPGLKHYPRVNYKKTILSPASWLLPKAIYQQKNIPQAVLIDELKAWFKKQEINCLVKTGNGDQTLCFDPNVTPDLIALHHYCKQQGNQTIYLSEALIDQQNEVTDEDDTPYTAQYIVNYYHNQTIYNALEQKQLFITQQAQIPKHYLPGSEWLYFEIYTPHQYSNGLLTNQIHYFLKSQKTYLHKWFFIRYEEHGSHLRLRLHLKAPAYTQQIIVALKTILTPSLNKGIVSNICIKTYEREIARYGALRMDLVENFFALNSKYVLLLLSKTIDDVQLYTYSLTFIKQLLNKCFEDVQLQLNFVQQMAKTFASEFKMDQQSFKQINRNYQSLKEKENWLVMQKPLQGNLQQLDLAYAIFEHCLAVERSKMLADLIHMYINRLFNADQRLHEAILYQYLLKSLQAMQSRLLTQSKQPISA